MKKNEIEVGRVYLAKVSGKLTRVKVLEVEELLWPKKQTLYLVENLSTGRRVTFRSAQRFRGLAGTANPYVGESLPRGVYWLNRHARGWGKVEVTLVPKRLESSLVWVKDLETGDEYPCRKDELKRALPHRMERR